jgi:hypothetical protein
MERTSIGRPLHSSPWIQWIRAFNCGETGGFQRITGLLYFQPLDFALNSPPRSRIQLKEASGYLVVAMLPPQHHNLELPSAFFVQKKQQWQRSDHQPIRNNLLTELSAHVFAFLSQIPRRKRAGVLMRPAQKQMANRLFR